LTLEMEADFERATKSAAVSFQNPGQQDAALKRIIAKGQKKNPEKPGTLRAVAAQRGSLENGLARREA
jgi:hypothetical protein